MYVMHLTKTNFKLVILIRLNYQTKILKSNILNKKNNFSNISFKSNEGPSFHFLFTPFITLEIYFYISKIYDFFLQSYKLLTKAIIFSSINSTV